MDTNNREQMNLRILLSEEGICRIILLNNNFDPQRRQASVVKRALIFNIVMGRLQFTHSYFSQCNSLLQYNFFFHNPRNIACSQYFFNSIFST
mmetsp:Transcript_16742/g.25299  ORF Transcript_16742/g.25299 Transcript_16742/m.25299 type:complete len:93 (-) Transcript_16742:698-976(-)